MSENADNVRYILQSDAGSGWMTRNLAKAEGSDPGKHLVYLRSLMEAWARIEPTTFFRIWDTKEKRAVH